MLDSKRLYPLILIASRLLLACTQLILNVNLFFSFSSLSRSTDFIHTRLSHFVDYSTLPSLPPIQEKVDPIFRLFMLRLTHIVFNKTRYLILVSSILIFFSLSLLTLLDAFSFSPKLSPRRTSLFERVSRLSLYLFSILVAILTLVVSLYHSHYLCHMEMLYPFLYKHTDEASNLLQSGFCPIRNHVLISTLISTLSLIPDTFSLLIDTVKRFKFYTLFHVIKFSLASLFLSLLVILAFTRWYVEIATDPNLMRDARRLEIWQARGIDLSERYPESYGRVADILAHSQGSSGPFGLHGPPQTPLLVYTFDHYLSYRVKESLRSILGINQIDTKGVTKATSDNPTNKVDKLDKGNANGDKIASMLSEQEIGQRELAHSEFHNDAIQQTLLVMDVFLYLVLYMVLVKLFTALLGFSAVYKKISLFPLIQATIYFVVLLMDLFNLVVLCYPLKGLNFFCNVKRFGTGEEYEAGVVFDWVGRLRGLVVASFVAVSIDAALSLGGIGLAATQ